MKAIILAGGTSSRLWPYSETMPKSSIPIANRPLISLIIDALITLNIETYVVVGYLGEEIKYVLRDKPNLFFVEQPNPIGTAGAVMNALRLISSDDLLIIYGDIALHPNNLKKFIEATKDARLCALVTPIEKERPQDWICAELKGDRIISIQGHPRSGNFRLCGVYFISRDFLHFLEKTPNFMRNVPVGGMPSQELELAQTFQMMIESGLDVIAVEAEGFFVDVDKPWHILEANRKYIEFLTSSIRENVIPPSSSVSPEAYIRGHVVLGENTHIGPRVVITDNLIVGDNTAITNGAIFTGPAVVGDNCFIYNYPQIGAYTSIGNKCHIGHCAEIEGVFFENVYVVHYSELYGVFGHSVDIGAATVCGTLRFDDGITIHYVKGRAELPLEGANAIYIGNFSRTGVNAIIMPGVKVGCYSLVGPGVMVYEDIPSHTLVLAKQELIQKNWGSEKYGW